ncbi:MAG: hypothetical protein HZB92_06350 [Euryarchaeota archaeon]|nr:hypothetical protein [Euryarchaeota archaeon]
MKKVKVTISIFWILLIALIFLSILPIYPLEIYIWFGRIGGPYTEGNIPLALPLFLILFKWFSWQFAFGGEDVVFYASFTASPLFLLIYPILIGIVVVIMRKNFKEGNHRYLVFEKETFQRGCFIVALMSFISIPINIYLMVMVTNTPSVDMLALFCLIIYSMTFGVAVLFNNNYFNECSPP